MPNEEVVFSCTTSREYRRENRNLASLISLITWSCQNCLVTVMSSEIDCDVISRTKTERVRHGDDVWRSSFVSSFMELLCHVSNKLMYVLAWRTVFCAQSSVIFGVYFPRCFTTQEINTKINLSWALKQFVTRVHTLFTLSSVILPTWYARKDGLNQSSME